MSRQPTPDDFKRRVHELERELDVATRVAECLRAERDSLLGALDLLPDPFAVFHFDGKVQRWNQAWVEIGGYSDEERARMRMTEFFAEEDLPVFMEKMEEVEEKGNATVELTVKTRDGRRIPYEFRGGLLRDPGGKPLGICGIGRDLAQRKRAEEALRESLSTSRALLDAIQDVVMLIDPRGRIDDANQTMAERYGRSVNELRGLSAFDLLPREVAERRLSYFRQALRSGRVVRYEDENGGRFFETGCYPVLDEKRRVAKVAVLARDITEEKRAREALEASEQRYRAIVENQTELICRWQPDGTLTFVNGAYCRCFGKTDSELVGRKFLPFIPREDRRRVREHCASFSPERPVATLEHRVVHQDGTVRWYQWTNQALYDSQGCLLEYQAVGRDVTERKQLQEEFARIEKLESLGVLAGGIAHDFNNILTAITTNISMAQTFGDVSDDVASLLADAETAAWQARNLTHRLLTFSKGGAPFPKPMPVARLVRETTGFALSGSNVRCDYDLPADLWLAQMDEGQISQVVQNLVINARQAMPEGGTIRVCAGNAVIGGDDPVPLKPGRYVRISVEDEGTGIPVKHLTKIFDPFFTTKHQGSGLGLAICFSIAKGHEGHIQVDSVLGAGTTFHVYLPAASGEVRDPEEGSTDSLRGEGRILIVDDDERVLRSAGNALKRLGYEVEPARSGEEALERYRNARAVGRAFQAVILDLTVPGGMGGSEAMEALHELDPQARVVVSSGYSNDPVVSDFRKFGFRGVLNKPYQIRELGEVLRRVIQGEDP